MVPFILIFTLVLFGFQLLDLMNVSPGFAGYDYTFIVPRLFDGILAFRAQGLLPPYYSSFLCGGFPFYADPTSSFYSVPQFLSFVIDPWKAVQATSFLFLLFGGAGAYFLARHAFSLGSVAAAGCAVFFASNGFFRSRMLIGHFVFHSFMLIPVLAYLLFHSSGRVLMPAVLVGLVASYFVQSGGHYVTFYAPIAVLLVSALYYAARKEDSRVRFKVFILRSLLGMLVAAALCASKITAALSLTGHLPRPGKFDYAKSFADAARLLYAQFIDPTIPPVLPWGRWEYDMSLGATVWPLAALGLFFLLKGSGDSLKITDRRPQLASLLLFFAGVYCALGLSTGLPPWVPYLRKLPILDQFRVNMRFSCVLILPLCLLAAMGLDRIRNTAVRAAILVLLAVSCAFSVEQIRPHATQYMSFPLGEISPFFQRIKSGEQVSVSSIGQRGGDDFLMMTRGEANPNCLQTFYGRPPTKKLKVGPVDMVTNGNFNLINPSCYWFPKENECRPGALIGESDRENFELLRKQNNPGWKISRWQRVANWTSMMALAAVIAVLTGFAIKCFRLGHPL